MSEGLRPIQDWDPGRYAENARFVSDLGGAVLDLLAARPGERILDLGCGDGALTKEIAALGARVVGVDASPDQVAAAQAAGLDAHVCDGHALTFENEFDAVFSNAALHWMGQPARVIAGVGRALKTGGRFVGEMGGAGNVVKIIAGIAEVLALRGLEGSNAHPWYFPRADEYAESLVGAGFLVREIRLISRPTRLPGDVGGWLDVFGDGFFRHVPAAAKAAVRDEIVERLRPVLCDADGVWWADYVRLRFAADLPR